MSNQLPFIRGPGGTPPTEHVSSTSEGRTGEPPGADQRPLSLIYEPYYGLKEKPFSLSADPRFLYKSRSHAPAFDDLLAAIRRREGLIVLTGDIGTGKTTLCRAVLQHLDRKTFTTFVPDPFLAREDLLKMLLVDFGVMSVDDLKSGRLKGASRPDLSYPLYEFLNSLVPLQAFAVLVIDEAQNLSLPLLEEIRILSDLEGREKLLQVVLVGQLELRSQLKLPQMRQLDQRVSVRCALDPLGPDAVAGYVTHRLKIAGGGDDRIEFSEEALEAVYRGSGGVPRLINLICDRALQRAYLRRVGRIDAELVRGAMADLSLSADSGAEAPTVLHSPPHPQEPRGLFEKTTGESLRLPTDADLRALLDMSPPSPAQQHQSEPATPVEPSELSAPEPTAPPWALGVSESRRSHGRGSRAWRRSPFAVALLMVALSGLALASVGYVQEIGRVFGKSSVMFLPSPPVLRVAEVFAPRIPASAYAALPDSPSRAPVGDPAAGAPPAADAYIIQVALFETAGRAGLVVKELADLGYRSYQIELDLGARGRLQQVLVGRYGTRAEAESDLERIRRIPDYADARVVSASPRVSP